MLVDEWSSKNIEDDNMKKFIAFPILILITFAIVFGGTLIALSFRSHGDTWAGEAVLSGNDKTYDKTYAAQPNGNLIIDADVGNITITGTDKKEVSISIIAHGPEDKVNRFHATSTQEDNTVKIEARLKHKYFSIFDDNSPDVNIEVQVPREFKLHLSTSGGNIALDNVHRPIDGVTSGGNLDLRGLEGKVKMNTSGGNISVKHSSGDFVLETSGGNIEGDDVKGPIHFETSGGNIYLRKSDGKVYASTSGGDIEVELSDNKGIELSTSGGNLSVHLPKTISADVRAQASGGDVSCDLPFNGKLREGSLHGKINGGGNFIRLETSGGDIVINSGE
jgi:DUF4097 and DUF4098 domain-containing protein YvlB